MQISENAYQQLLTNLEWLAWCRESANVSQLLERLKGLWQCEDAADDVILNFLSERNSHPLEIDITHLAGHWLPYRYDARTRTLCWCLPNGHPTEPFHDEHVSHCRQQVIFNQLVQPKTSLASLQFWRTPAEGLMPPTGFIFHLSRCGSTLLTGCLSELNNACVLSESQLLTEILLDKTLNNEDKVRLLPRLIHLQSCLYPGRDKVVVKWNAWDIFHWHFLRELYSQTPVILLVRNPLEILASHARQAGRHMSGDKSLRAMHPVFAAGYRRDGVRELRINVLRELMDEMLKVVNEPDVELIDYDGLYETRIQQAAEHFGLTIKADERLRVRRRMTVHSKQPEQVFRADGQTKQSEINDDDRNYAWSKLGTTYQQLIAKGTATPMTLIGVEALG